MVSGEGNACIIVDSHAGRRWLPMGGLPIKALSNVILVTVYTFFLKHCCRCVPVFPQNHNMSASSDDFVAAPGVAVDEDATSHQIRDLVLRLNGTVRNVSKDLVSLQDAAIAPAGSRLKAALSKEHESLAKGAEDIREGIYRVETVRNVAITARRYMDLVRDARNQSRNVSNLLWASLCPSLKADHTGDSVAPVWFRCGRQGSFTISMVVKQVMFGQRAEHDTQEERARREAARAAPAPDSSATLDGHEERGADTGAQAGEVEEEAPAPAAGYARYSAPHGLCQCTCHICCNVVYISEFVCLELRCDVFLFAMLLLQLLQCANGRAHPWPPHICCTTCKLCSTCDAQQCTRSQQKCVCCRFQGRHRADARPPPPPLAVVGEDTGGPAV